MNRITRTAGRFLCFVMLAALLARVAHAFNPKDDIPGNACAVWLRADLGVVTSGGKVTTWQDQSDNNRNASQGSAPDTPTLVASGLNGQPVIRFDGGDGLTLGNISAAFSNAATLFIVSTINSDDNYNLFTTKVKTEEWAPGNPSPGFADTWWRTTYGVPPACGYNGVFTHTHDYTPVLAALPSSGSHVFAVESSSNRWAMWVNGSILNDVGGKYSGGDEYRIGMHDDGIGDSYLSGDIAEIIIYNRELTEAERNQVGFYLSDRYGLITTYEGPPPPPPPPHGTLLIIR